ncbi:hypothetical protein IQ07DRAFT_642533 [Pyrenochaeta sp. DS3sAY3a]|nr:hypothetical protein IQ07DRAFT_642533 [Pyrenochaeta sp. DS3sAY3a]
MKVAIILSALFAAVMAAPAAEAQPEAQPALELEKRCLANGADCIRTPNDCCSGSCFMDKGTATYRCAPW